MSDDLRGIFGTGKSPHPKAHSVDVYTCGDPECGHPHLILFDKEGKIICEAVLPTQCVAKCVKVIKGET